MNEALVDFPACRWCGSGQFEVDWDEIATTSQSRITLRCHGRERSVVVDYVTLAMTLEPLRTAVTRIAGALMDHLPPP